MPDILNAFRMMYPRIEPGMLLAARARAKVETYVVDEVVYLEKA